MKCLILLVRMEKAIAIVTKAKFIRNMRLPVCYECSYFIQGTQKTGKCSKFGEKNVVSGKIAYVNAEEARTVENMCSQRGIHFEQK